MADRAAPEHDTTEDGFLDRRLVIAQPRRGFRAGHESVLLAAAVPARRAERVLELGLGAGVPLACLAARVDGLTAIGLEADASLAGLAGANLTRNIGGAITAGDFRVEVGEVADPPASIRRATFDHVFFNPPFFAAERAQAASDAARARARRQPGSDLKAWIDTALGALRPGGTLTLVQTSEALGPALAALETRAGALALLPLWPRAGVPADRFILRAVKGAAPACAISPGLVLHKADGRFTEEADRLLRAPLPLDLPGFPTPG